MPTTAKPELGAAHSDILDSVGFMRADLPGVTELLRWAWTSAWDAPSESQPGRERGVVHRAPDEDHPVKLGLYPDCFVPGARLELGVGDYRAQRALQVAGPLLGKCDRILAAACVAAARPDDHQLPAILTISASATLPELLLATRSIAWRLTFIADRVPPLDKPVAKDVRRLTTKARDRLESANGALARALNRGKAQAGADQVANEKCIICGIRSKRLGRERCSTCDTWKQRNRGQERPTSLDADYHESLAAKKRRLRRDEGWGAA